MARVDRSISDWKQESIYLIRPTAILTAYRRKYSARLWKGAEMMCSLRRKPGWWLVPDRTTAGCLVTI